MSPKVPRLVFVQELFRGDKFLHLELNVFARAILPLENRKIVNYVYAGSSVAPGLLGLQQLIREQPQKKRQKRM